MNCAAAACVWGYAVPAMNERYCDSCGYELLGLPMRGKCPECGEPFGVSGSVARKEPLLVRHGFSIGIGILAVMILTCGGVLSIWSTKPLNLIVTTLCVAGVFGGGAVLLYLGEKKTDQ